MDVKKLDPEKKPYFVINRLLDKGDIEAARWIKKTFSNEQIRYTLTGMQDFSLRSGSFWGLIYQVPINKLKCFQEPYLTTRKTLWPY